MMDARCRRHIFFGNFHSSNLVWGSGCPPIQQLR
jgi:hypothetical protein